MKYIVIAFIVAFIASCSPFAINIADYSEMDETLYAAWTKTSSYDYIPEEGNRQYWKSPKQFEADGGGDCEDFTGHLLYNLGEGEAVIVKYYRDGKERVHCIAKYRGLYLEPQVYNRYLDLQKLGWIIVDEYSWNEYMSLITGYGTREI